MPKEPYSEYEFHLLSDLLRTLLASLYSESKEQRFRSTDSGQLIREFLQESQNQYPRVVWFISSEERERFELWMKDQVGQRDLSNFLEGAEHSLLTPLAIIGSSLYLIRRSKQLDPAKLEKHLEKMEREYEGLRKIVEMLLKLSRLERELGMVTDWIRLDELLRQCVLEVEASALKKAVQVRLVSGTDLKVHCDIEYLKVAVCEVMRNTIHRTRDNGKIWILSSEKHETVHISVQYTGRSLSVEDVELIPGRLFGEQPDEVGESEIIRLGLQYALHIIAGHGGSIRAGENSDHRGEFRIELPSNHWAKTS